MSTKPFPARRDPLQRLGGISLIGSLGGLLAIAFAIIQHFSGGAGTSAWVFALGLCLVIGSAVAAQIQLVLLSHRARIEALEKRLAEKYTQDATAS